MKTTPSRADTDFYETFSDESRIMYYSYIRQEVIREDEITHQRLTWAITFQGFLINALGIMLVFTWDNIPIEVFFLRKMSLYALGVIGLFFGVITYNGIIASRNSIEDVKSEWNLRNHVWRLHPNRVPQTFGQGGRFRGGTLYAIFVPASFVALWSAYLFAYTAVSSIFWFYPCRGALDKGIADGMRCLYDIQNKDPDAMFRGISDAFMMLFP